MDAPHSGRSVGTLFAAPLLLSLSLLAGCGGGSGTPATAAKTSPTGTAAVAPGKDAYTIQDLGAADYYYGYYGSINNFGRYGPDIVLNDKTQIVTPNNGTASVYDGGTLHTLSSTYSAAYGLNNNGQTVGYQNSNTPSSYSNDATVWQADGSSLDLASGTGAYNSMAYAINNAGFIVGQATLPVPLAPTYYGYVQHAFLYTTTFMDIGTLGGDYSTASGINDSAEVVGWSTLANAQAVTNFNGNGYPVHAFAYYGGQMHDMGTLPGGQSSDAASVNTGGMIVGSSSITPQGLYSFAPLHSVYWLPDGIHDMGTLGGPSSIGYGINDAGSMVGSADTTTIAPTPPSYSYYYGYYGYAGGGTGGTGGLGGGGAGGSVGTGSGTSGGGSNSGSGSNPISAGAGGGIAHKSAQASKTAAAALGTTGANAAGSRAGAIDRRTRGIGDTYIPHAFLYTGGKMIDLNTQIGNSPGWELLEATDINNKGQIVGFGTLGNHLHAFLMTPK